MVSRIDSVIGERTERRRQRRSPHEQSRRQHGDCQISRGSNENGTEAASLIVAASGCA